MSVGERIRALRKENSLTQETLAEALDVSRQAVAKWESGKSSPSTANLVKMAELFNVSFAELIPENEELSTKEQLDDIRQSIVRLETEARERRVYFERAKELTVSGLAAAGGFAVLILLVRTLLSFPSVPDYVLSWTLENHILPALLVYALAGSLRFGRRFGVFVLAGAVLGILLGTVTGWFSVKYTELHFNDGEIALLLCMIVFSAGALAAAFVREKREKRNSLLKNPAVKRVFDTVLLAALAGFIFIGGDYSAHELSFERGALAGYHAGMEQGILDREMGLPADSRKTRRSVPESYREGSARHLGYTYYWPTGYHKGYKGQERPDEG